ncbi:MAG: hypothetical protein ACYDB2_05305 [Acidimicrobiales bacterium]
MDRHKHRWPLRHASFFIAAALVLSACGTSPSPAGLKASRFSPPTEFVAQSSQCTGTVGFLTQSITGNVTGCFRVPANEGKSLVVSLQASILSYGIKASGPTTTQRPKRSGVLSIAVTSSTAHPGDHVAVVGTYAPGSSVARSSYATLCWDGCQTGLTEQAVPLHWTGRLSFRTSLLVPPTAWLELDQGSVSVHPLISGTYGVAIQCVQQTSGCALGAPDARTTITLDAPARERCVKGRSCMSLHLSTRRAAVGDEVIVHGWAPLQSLIGQPYGFDLSIAPSNTGHYAAFSASRTAVSVYNVVVAPTILSVAPDRTWASLGRLAYASSSWSGPSTLSPVPGSSETAWCSETGPLLANGTTSAPVRTSGVAATLHGSGLSLLPGAASTPRCASILADPLHHSSIFVGFDAAVGASIPPVFMAGLFTTNAGASWQWVPTPAGLVKQDFSGFAMSGPQVVAVFFDASQGGGGYDTTWPLGSDHGVIHTEVTSNGGVSWMPSTLGCANRGPCVSFGPSLLGNCAMNGSSQSLMTGAPGSTTGTWDVWHNSSWVSTVNNCFSQQLVTTSAHGLLLVDPSSQFELLQSSDSGQSWVNRSVPSIPGQTSPLSLGDVVLFTPTGDLLAMVTSPSSTQRELFLLSHGATSWCKVPNVFTPTKAAWTVDSMRVDAHDLLWSQTLLTNSATSPSQLQVLSLSKISC